MPTKTTIPPYMLVECAACGWPLGYGAATHRYLHGHEFAANDEEGCDA